jgi:hypothetical protein
LVGLIHANLLVWVSFDWWVAKRTRHHTKAVGPGQSDPRGPGRPARPAHRHLQRLDHQSRAWTDRDAEAIRAYAAMLAQLVGPTSDVDVRHKGELAASSSSRWSPEC